VGAGLLPKYDEFDAGLEMADSWATDAHKWLNVGYDSGVVLVRDECVEAGDGDVCCVSACGDTARADASCAGFVAAGAGVELCGDEIAGAERSAELGGQDVRAGEVICGKIACGGI